MQGQHASVMTAHEDDEDDAHQIKLLCHAAQVGRHLVVGPKAPSVSHFV